MSNTNESSLNVSESEPPPICAICLENLPGQNDYCKTSCGHEFHLSCMLTYGIYKKGALTCVEATSVMCPLCRKELHRRRHHRHRRRSTTTTTEPSSFELAAFFAVLLCWFLFVSSLLSQSDVETTVELPKVSLPSFPSFSESQEIRDEKAKDARTSFNEADSSAKEYETKAKQLRDIASDKERIAMSAKEEACKTRFGGNFLCIRSFGSGY